MSEHRTEIIETAFRQKDEEFWIDVLVNRTPYAEIGPFDTDGERQRACDDLLGMMRSLGGLDLPVAAQ